MDDSGGNPKLIGAFVLGGFVLLLGALLLFSSGDYFEPKRKFIAYFEQSVNGLQVGAPIKFRGIPVGEVLEITGVYNPDSGRVIPRVVLEFKPESLTNAVIVGDEYTLFPSLLKAGVRASLKSQSLLTGQLYVSLDFYPEEGAPRLRDGNDPYPEMPTINTGLDEVMGKLSELPIEDVLARLVSTLAAAETVLTDLGVKETLTEFPLLVVDVRNTVTELRSFISSNMVGLTNEASETLATTSSSIKTISTSLTDKSLGQLEASLGELNTTLQLFQQRLGRDDPLTIEMLETLREANYAFRSVRALADELEENPESMLMGKQDK